MAEGYGPSSCSSSLALKSTLLRSLEVQYGLVPKLSNHGGKNHRPGGLKDVVSSSRENMAQPKICLICDICGLTIPVRSFFSVSKANGVFAFIDLKA